MKEYKRKYRELSDEAKNKISVSSKGKRKSVEHRQHISQGMKDYWANVPNQPKHTTIDDLLGNNNNL